MIDCTLLAQVAAMTLAGAACSRPQSEGLWIRYQDVDGPGKGVHVVLIGGDEEYRSGEALPQLGKILATRHGFTCTVLFAIDPETGTIDPEHRGNIPGLAALADADLMIIATRFRNLPDDQMAHIDAYVRAGKPIIGMRTATHAFAMDSGSAYQRYSWNSTEPGFEQGFGRQILGETWIAHHGHHGQQSTRGVIADDARDHPIARGIADGAIWGPTDVYRVRLPLPGDSHAIVLGQVLVGMSPDDEPVEGEQNTPPMPVGWTKTYQVAEGRRGRVFTTTMGAATDLVAEGTRRMLVNAVYWALGKEQMIPEGGTDVGLVGSYEPTDFGFGGHRRGVRPEDHAIVAGSAP
jgi:type 1 glutamine amidotransferase